MIKNLEEELENLENYTNDLHERYDEKKAENIKLKKQLAIAVNALNWYDGLEDFLIGWEFATGQKKGTAKQALNKIKELEK
jgi:hypothetical protein